MNQPLKNIRKQETNEMNIGVFISSGKNNNQAALTRYAEQLVEDIDTPLENSTGISWFFDMTDPEQLENDNVRSPADFLDSASLRMAEGPYDLIVVITDVPVRSIKNRMEAGIISNVARILVISTRKLTVTGKKQVSLQLDDPQVRFNSVLLVFHLIGHMLGLRHTRLEKSSIMGTTDFQKPLHKVPSYSEQEKKQLRKHAAKAPDAVLTKGNFLQLFIFHIAMVLRNPKAFFVPLLKNKAIFLPLSLPGLATAAVAPALLLVFTAEIWDVGFGMSNTTATIFAVSVVFCASLYLVNVQSLFLPRKEKRVLTEHLAVSNAVIYFSILMACLGLFLMMVSLMLIIELYIFPTGLMKTWPTLEHGNIILKDKIRLAAFISTVSVATGALAGGMESRTLIQHLALFRSKP